MAEDLLLYLVFAVLLAIVYSLKRMFLLEKRIMGIELNMERLLEVIAMEEERIEKTESAILQRVALKPKKKR